MNYFFVALGSFLIGLIMVRLALWLFPKIGLMDRPDKYGLKRRPIPYYGGIAVLIAFFLAILIWVKIDLKILIFLIGGVFVAVISFIDDKKRLSPLFRLSIQILAGLGLFLSGVAIESFPSPLGGELNLMFFDWNIPWLGVSVGIFSLLITVLWVVLIMNTMNWIDGLNGLPSGVTVIASLTIFALSIRPDLQSTDQTTVAVIALILAMVTLAFWFYDVYPARILMGDTGSMFLGYALAALAIFSGGKVATAFLVMGIPILDAFWVITRRILTKKSPFSGDLKHFHHRLIYAGLSERKALMVIYVTAIVFGGLAVFLGNIQKIWAIIALFSTMAILGFGIVVLEVEKSRKKD